MLYGHQRRRAAWECTSVATAVASACGGKTGRPIHRMIAWGRVGGRVAGGGQELRANLDRGDLRYQRKQARIVRRAVHVVVPAAAAVEDTYASSFRSPRSYRR